MSEPLELPDALPIDTLDVREGPEIHPSMLSLLPLLGEWRGEGRGTYPGIDDFRYGQEIKFWHDGRPFLGMQARSWLMDEEGNFIRPAGREMGFWRPGEGDDFEVVITQMTGVVEVFVGQARTTTSWELSSDLVARTASAKEVAGDHRLYGIVEGDLMYAMDMAAMGKPLQPHISARLARVR